MSDENFQPTDLADIIPDNHASIDQPDQMPAPEAQPEQPSEPTGVNEADQPQQSESPSDDQKQETPQSIPFAAYQNERQQRQEAQDRAARLEAEHQQLIASLQQQAQQPEQEAAPEFWDDPDGFFATKEQQLEHKFEQRLHAIEQQNVQRHMAQSELIMRQHAPDYEDTMQVFRNAVDAMPPEQRGALAMQMQQNDHPAKFAYDMAKQMQAMQQVGADPDAYREKVRQELLAEMRQGQPGQPQPNQRAPVPTSLAGVPNAAPASTPVAWQGPTPLSQLIPE